MNVLSGQNVDLIYPFPEGEQRRVFGWSRCYRTFIDNDALPTRLEPYTQYIHQFLGLPHVFSWGVIDKNHLTNDRHEAPLVGLIAFEAAAYGGYMHFASARKAFKMGLMDEALALAVQHVFESSPQVLRVGVHLDDRNYPAKAIFRGLGFKYEGTQESAFLQHGTPHASVAFGLSRQRYEAAFATSPAEFEETPLGPSIDTTDALNAAGWGAVDAVEGYETGGIPDGSSTSTPIPSATAAADVAVDEA